MRVEQEELEEMRRQDEVEQRERERAEKEAEWEEKEAELIRQVDTKEIDDEWFRELVTSWTWRGRWQRASQRGR
jgi:hypothetical protein